MICWVPWCLSMAPSSAVKPPLFEAIKRCNQILNSSDQDDVRVAALEEFKQAFENSDSTERFDGFTPFLYLLNDFGFNEQLVRAAAQVVLKIPEKQECKSHPEYKKRKKVLRSFVNARIPKSYRTALHYAAAYGYFWLVHDLIAAGADIQAVDSNNANAHHYVCGCDTTLVPNYVQDLQQEFEPITIKNDRLNHQVMIPLSMFKGLGLFIQVLNMSPWGPVQCNPVEVNQAVKKYALNISHRAQIMKFLIGKMLFHSSSDNNGKSPRFYAQQAGYLLIEYILQNQHFQQSVTDKFFYHGLISWATIFGHLNNLVSVSD